MHGISLGSTFLITGEVDSMGGTLYGGVGISTKPSPRRTEMEKAQAELRLEYDVREERRRELEFLEKGGDPLDFRFGHGASVSVQSTSHTDQDSDQNFTSEAKGSIALTASPQGDSVDSSGCLGVTIACEPDSADNFDAENEILRSDRNLLRAGRCSITPLEGSSQFDGRPNVKDFEDSLILHPKKDQAYRRRFRSRTNLGGPRSSSADLVSRGGHDSSVAACPAMLSKPVAFENQFETEIDDTCVMPLSTPRVTEFAEGNLSLSNSKEKSGELKNASSKADEAPVDMKMIESTAVTAVGRDSLGTVGVECPSSSGVEITEDNATSAQLNETSMINEDNKCTSTYALIEDAPVVIKGLDSESSCTRTNFTVDGNRNIDSDLCTDLKNVDSNRACTEPTLTVGENTICRDEKLAIEEHTNACMETASSIKDDNSPTSLQGNGATEDHAEVDRGKSSLQDKVKGLSNFEEIKSETDIGDCVPKMDSFCLVRPPVDNASSDSHRNGFPGPSPVVEATTNQPKALNKAHEDRILEKGRTIETKRRRIARLPKLPLQREPQQKCHWDLVLEEMAWLANDFAQERVWKMAVAAQICHRIAFARIRLKEQNKMLKQKSVAHTLAKAVMEFWHLARLSVDNADSSLLEKCKHEASSVVHEMDMTFQDVLQSSTRKQGHAVSEYAVRFLQFDCSSKPFVEVEVPPFVSCDVDLPDVSWQHQFTEENLFYAVPPGAMEMYRNSVESHLAQCERIGISIQEEVDTSGHDAAAECGYEDNGYEEDEGENLYHLHGTSNTSKLSKNKQKNMMSYAARSYEFGGDLGYGNFPETRNGIPQLKLIGKRPTNSLHVDPIPTKRIRTRRVVSPFGTGPAGFPPVLSRADASSGDTNSFQDDHGSVVPRGSEVDSAMDFENHSTFGSAEMSVKPKKKKKIKYQCGPVTLQSVSFDQRWQLDSSMQNEQNDLVIKRMETNQLESNGNGGSFGQHAKKPKLAKHSLDSSFDNSTPMSGPVASPVASQMSNMSSQTKIIKFIGGRDRGKKGKGHKVSTGQLGSGSLWTIVEDQALVVLVHDMGPNWELVSDAMNNILQFKCIFRKPPECKERHKFLMDKPSGDGAEDSGSSQPYPSQLPGIPKGSARQLFRSLHAHVEEDNIKSRFEKIICIEQQLHFRKKKNDNQDLKQIVPIHGSHILSLSQVTPNNVDGGVLTPLDLCDASTSNPDPLSIEYKGSHAGGLPPSNQGNSPPMHLPGGLNLSLQGLQGSLSMGIGNNLASPPSQFSSPRDARYSIPRSGSLPIEEQQRLHQYNSMLPGRNIQASFLSSSGPPSSSDRAVRMHPGGNGVSMMHGINRSIPMARPGVQGIPSSPVSSEHQRQIIMPEVEIQKTQNNSTGVPPLGGLGSGFSNHHPHVLGSPHPHHPHLSSSNHSITPEQQHAYLRHQLQKQRLLQQQLQKNPSSVASMPHVQTPSQMSSSLQNTSQLQSPSTSQQQKNLQGHGRSVQNGSGGTINQGGKQRQQQYQQSGRQHPQQRQLSESHQVKVVKGSGRGNMLMHQNLPIDSSHSNGLSADTANQISEGHIQPQKPYVNRGPATPKPVQQISSHLEGGNQGHLTPSMVHSRNHQQLQGQSAANRVNQYHPAFRKTGQHNRQVNSESLTKSQVEHSQEKHQSSSVGPPPVRVNSASNVVHKVRVPVGDSAVTSVSSTSGPISSEAIKNPVGNEPPSSGKNLV